jgi:hypothetical protein
MVRLADGKSYRLSQARKVAMDIPVILDTTPILYSGSLLPVSISGTGNRLIRTSVFRR